MTTVPVSMSNSMLVLHFGDVTTGAGPLILTQAGFREVFGIEQLDAALSKFVACPSRQVLLLLTGRIVEN